MEFKRKPYHIYVTDNTIERIRACASLSDHGNSRVVELAVERFYEDEFCKRRSGRIVQIFLKKKDNKQESGGKNGTETKCS